jgi:hypothetical protein
VVDRDEAEVAVALSASHIDENISSQQPLSHDWLKLSKIPEQI